MRIIQVKIISRYEVKAFELPDNGYIRDVAKEAAQAFGLTPGSYSFQTTRGVLGSSTQGPQILSLDSRGRDVPNNEMLILVNLQG